MTSAVKRSKTMRKEKETETGHKYTWATFKCFKNVSQQPHVWLCMCGAQMQVWLHGSGVRFLSITLK